MQYELAPMEGITGYIYRNAYAGYFGDMDRYYTPFIASTGLNHKERNDVLPEHNAAFLLGEESVENIRESGTDRQGKNSCPRLIPQILTNRAEDFLTIAARLEQMGYTHVNLNLGCPSGTVVSKGRGAGFLEYPRELAAFLEEIFTKCSLYISIKTRIGVKDSAQWEEILHIYAEFPVEELIIHPRVQQDYYRNPVRWEDMDQTLENLARWGSKIPLCLNGDIHTLADYKVLRQRYPQIERVMLGRGILKDPFLVQRLQGWEKGDTEEMETSLQEQREILRVFHQELLDGYREIMSGDRDTLFRMKELWTYLGTSFPGKEKALKGIRKAATMSQYRAAVADILG